MIWVLVAVVVATMAAAGRSIRSDPRKASNPFWLMAAVIMIGGAGSLAVGVAPAAIIVAMLSPILVLVLVVALLVNGVITWRYEGASLANLLSLLAGLGIIVAVGFCLSSLILSTLAPWLVAIAAAVVIGFGWLGFLLTAYLLYALVYPALWRRPRPDFVVVHGSGLVRGQVARLLGSRIDAGIACWQRAGGEIPLIMSGGQGPDEPRSEAAAMAEYALARGVPASAILIEDRSRTTEENLAFSRDLVRERLGEQARGVSVTSDYHVLRTAALARDIGFDVQVASARSALYFRVNAFLREFVALIYRHRWRHLIVACLVCLPLPLLIGLAALAS